jgi:hypothetical protein
VFDVPKCTSCLQFQVSSKRDRNNAYRELPQNTIKSHQNSLKVPKLASQSKSDLILRSSYGTTCSDNAKPLAYNRNQLLSLAATKPSSTTRDSLRKVQHRLAPSLHRSRKSPGPHACTTKMAFTNNVENHRNLASQLRYSSLRSGERLLKMLPLRA